MIDFKAFEGICKPLVSPASVEAVDRLMSVHRLPLAALPDIVRRHSLFLSDEFKPLSRLCQGTRHDR